MNERKILILKDIELNGELDLIALDAVAVVWVGWDGWLIM